MAYLGSAPGGAGWLMRAASAEPQRVAEPVILERDATSSETDWTSVLNVRETGQYEFTLEVRGDAQLDVDGQRLVTAAGIGARATKAGTVELPLGSHTAHVHFLPRGPPGYLRLFWRRMDVGHGWYAVPLPRDLAWPDGAAATHAPAPLSASERAAAWGLALWLAWLGALLLWLSRHPSSDAVRRDVLLATSVALCAFAVRAVHMGDVDIHWDEGAYFKAGQLFWRNASLGDWAAASYRYNVEHPPLAKWFYGLAEVAGGAWGGKILAAFFQSLTCWLLYWTVLTHASRMTATLAAFFLAFFPYVVAHGRITGLESPSLLFFSLAVFLLLRACRTWTPAAHFLWMAVGILGMAVRATNVWFLGVAAGVLLVSWRKQRQPLRPLWGAGAGLLSSLLLVFMLWPVMWEAPLQQVQTMMKHWNGSRPQEWVLGVLQHPPWWYFAFGAAVVTPLGLGMLAVVGVVGAARRRTLLDVTVVLWCCMPLLQSFSAMRQDGARYVVTLFPALCMAAALGVEELARRWPRGAHVFPVLASGYLVATWAAIHPYGLDYCSEWTGGAGAVQQKRWLEVPFWGEGELEVAEAINRMAPVGASVRLELMPHDDFPGLRRDLRETRAANADYLVKNFYQFPPPPRDYLPIYEVRAGGALLAAVYQRR